MTLLDEGIQAQKKDRFVSWYLKLTPNERRRFDNELVELVTRISGITDNLVSAMNETMGHLAKAGPTETK